MNIQGYLYQVETNEYMPVDFNVYTAIEEEGFVDDLRQQFNEEFTEDDFVYTLLQLDDEDKKGLINLTDETVSKFNQFDIHLKDSQDGYPTVCDFIDYESGNVYIVKLDR